MLTWARGEGTPRGNGESVTMREQAVGEDSRPGSVTIVITIWELHVGAATAQVSLFNPCMIVAPKTAWLFHCKIPLLQKQTNYTKIFD